MDDFAVDFLFVSRRRGRWARGIGRSEEFHLLCGRIALGLLVHLVDWRVVLRLTHFGPRCILLRIRLGCVVEELHVQAVIHVHHAKVELVGSLNVALGA